MSSWEKFGQDRHRPAGNWVETSLPESVVGLQYRKQSAQEFCKAVRAAEKASQVYSVGLLPEPSNPNDPHAIKVFGLSMFKPFFGQWQTRRWHIGYLSSELAVELHKDLLSKGMPIAAELHSISIKGDFVDIKVVVLAPPGFSHEARMRQI